jgi:hypothetical protein
MTPSQIAVLTPSDVASAQRLEEIERAKQAVLEQHVKSTADSGNASGIRLGRDGFERVEDRREVELTSWRRVEEAAREKDRRESLNASADLGGSQEQGEIEEDVGGPPNQSLPPTPGISQFPKLSHKRSESTEILPVPVAAASPVKSTFALTSAWGGAGGEGLDVKAMDFAYGEDQVVDLSDIPILVEDIVQDEPVETETKLEMKDEVAEFLTRPIVWSGGVSVLS